MTSVPLDIGADHPAFVGHFPSRPIVPGVVLLDHALRALALHRAADASTRCRVSAAKFLSPVGPGEPTRLAFEATDVDRYRLTIYAGAPSDERVALSSDVAFETTGTEPR